MSRSRDNHIADLTSPNGIKVNGVWSAAGIASSINIVGLCKKQGILFDCGIIDGMKNLDVPHIFISHSHVDHIGQCISLARIKALQKWPGKYYVPYEAVEALEEARIAMSKLDGQDIPMEIIPIKPGDEIVIDKTVCGNIIQMKVKVFQTIHRIPSQGYAIYLTHRGKMKEEYITMDKEAIRDFRLNGENIYEDPYDTLELIYTGDTTIDGLLLPDNKFIFKAPILITELTYLEGDRLKAAEKGHLHIDDIVENVSKFENEKILFVHLSLKYRAEGIAVKLLRQSLPESILQRVYVSLRCFGNTYDVTKVAAVEIEKREREVVGTGWGIQKKSNNNKNNSNNNNNSNYNNNNANSNANNNTSNNGKSQYQYWKSKNKKQNNIESKSSSKSKEQNKDESQSLKSLEK